MPTLDRCVRHTVALDLFPRLSGTSPTDQKNKPRIPKQALVMVVVTAAVEQPGQYPKYGATRRSRAERGGGPVGVGGLPVAVWSSDRHRAQQHL